MSLLMDALRKAELEKKEAARRLEETAGHARTGEAGAEVEKTIAEAPGDTSTERPITRLDRTHNRTREELFAATSQLSLEPIERLLQGDGQDASVEETIQQSPADAPAVDPALEETIAETGVPGSTEDTFSLDLTSEHFVIDGDSEDKTDTRLEISGQENALQDQGIPGLYEETLHGEEFSPDASEYAYDETLPGVPAAELARDLGEEFQPTPVAAQTVFTASASRTGKGFNWPLIGGLTAVVVIAFGIVAYQLVTPHVVDIPQQQLVGDLNLIQQPGQDLSPPPVTTTDITSSPLSDSGIEEDISTIQGDARDDVTVADENQVLSGEFSGAVTVEPEPGEQDIEESAATGSVADVDQTEQGGPEPAESAPITLQPGLIRISRSSSPDPRSAVLTDAYSAYRQGDYSAAKRHYTEVLKQYPDNRDALLGLGAIAMKEGNVEEVYRVYSHIFRIDPRDRLARAVLINLNAEADPVNRESTLKNMINEHPDEAFLYFSLGNVYASQSRWAEAQQAFFDAYRNDAANPDYALNLAISLDHMGQPETALDYYNTALKLSDDQVSGFDSALVLARIQTLTDGVPE